MATYIEQLASVVTKLKKKKFKIDEMMAIFRSPKVAHSSTCAIFSMKFTIFLLSFSRLMSSNLTDFALVGFLVYSRAIPMSFFAIRVIHGFIFA